MVKPVDITKTVIVPKPHNKQDNLKSFFHITDVANHRLIHAS